MASQAEQASAGLTLANFAQATDLKKRLWFTVGALIVFRVLSYVPLPGIDPQALSSLFATTKGGVLDLFNNFSGGSLQRMSIIALGVMPYIRRRSLFSFRHRSHPRSTRSRKRANRAARSSTNTRATALLA